MLKKLGFSLTLLLILGASLTIGSPDLTSDLAPNVKTPFQQYIPAQGPITDTVLWMTKAPLPSTHAHHMVASATVLGHYKYYTFGGTTVSGGAQEQTVREYDVETDAWSTKANMPTARGIGRAATVRGLIYVIGGCVTFGTGLSTVEVYNPETNSWTSGPSMPAGNHDYGIGVWRDSLIYVVGGGNWSAPSISTVRIFDPLNGTWTTGTSMPITMGCLGCDITGDTIVVATGYSGGAAVTTTMIGVINPTSPTTITWQTVTPIPGLARYRAFCGIFNGELYLIGGNHPTASQVLNEAWKYNPQTNTWTQLPNKPTAASNVYGLGVNPDGYLYAAGGYNPALSPTYLTIHEALLVEQPRAHDVGVQSIVSPTGRIPSGSPINVEAVIKNFGSNEETFPATALIMTQTDDTVFAKESTLTITARTEQSVVFGEFTPDPDMVYDVMFYTALVGDENPANDTLMDEARTTPDAGATRIVSPLGKITPGVIVDAQAVIMNYSAEPKDVPATLTVVDTVTGSTILDKDTTLALGAAESLSVVFGQFTGVIGSFYDIIAYTSLAGDDDPTNDTTTATAVCRFGSAPDSFGYFYESTQEPGDTVTFSWIDPAGGTQLTGWAPSADDGIVSRTLPFAFKFYTTGAPNITQINVCTNGFLETSTVTTYLNTALPNNTIQNLIAPFWDDMNLTTSGAVYENIGTDASYVVYTYVGVPRYNTTELQTFQVVLYRNTNKIRFNYLDVNGTLNDNTIGIQGATGAGGFYQQYVFGGVPPNHIVADSTSIVFSCDRVVGIEDTRDVAPTANVLHIAKPNPAFKGTAQISFSIAKSGVVSIDIYDATGRIVRNLVNSPYAAGEYTVTWDGKNDRGNESMAGVYFYTIKTANYKSTRKLVLMR